MNKYFLISLCSVSVCFSSDYLSPNYFLNQKNNSSTSDLVLQTQDFNYLIGIMIDFPVERETFEDLDNNGYWTEGEPFDDVNGNGSIDYHDYNGDGLYNQEFLLDSSLYYEDYDNPKTSGLGKFILDTLALNYNLEKFTSRCNGLIVDNFPHDVNYFSNQLLAVKNYYNSISNGLIDLEYSMIDSIYTASNYMEYYSSSDEKLGELFSESLILSKDDIENYLAINNIDVNDVLFIVFHAGLGQDFNVPFLDPTVNDLKSAYIDDEMLDVFNLSTINDVGINRGILLPETQNFIFYDVVEDIFPELKDDIGYCEIQVGLTGTFAFLLGYGFDLNPMFLSNGTTGVGKFGLMDYGSNNGRGVIPAPPTPWTRIKLADKYSTSNQMVEIINQSGIYTLEPRHINDVIYKIPISDSEYYLIENRSNQIVDEFDLDFLQFIYGGDCSKGIDINNISDNEIDNIKECMDNYISTDKYNYFDLLNILEDFSLSNTNVITSINNYDYGLPGSGILIWHIDEKRITNNLNDVETCGSINCNLEIRGIELEEADGAIDIGYSSSHPLFTEHVNGWEYDFWYPGNQYYFNYGNNELSNNDTLFFNNYSNPSTQSNQGSTSLISIQIIEKNGENISFNVSFDEVYESISLSDSSIDILGSGIIDDIGNIFYIEEDAIYQHNNLEKIQLDESISASKKVLIYDNAPHFHDLVENNLVYWDVDSKQVTTDPNPFIGGYYESSDMLSFLISDNISVLGSSFGDVDSDGLDELVFISPGGSLIVQNFNETYVNGFPVLGNFYGTPIIANIINIEDDKPEIICRENNQITILSFDGKRLLELSSMGSSSDIRVIPDWKDNKAALVDGNRLILVDYDNENSYWLNKYANSYDYPVVLNNSNTLSEFNNEIQKAYNYPNPIQKGYTTFRFYATNDDRVEINIYDINGFKIKSLIKTNISNNEYNEIEWSNIKNLNSGLYYAEVVFENRESELIKLAIIQ